MQFPNQRDFAWLAASLAVSGVASAALQAAVLAPANRTISDLDWPAILLCMGVAMFGGLLGTLYEVHLATKEKREIDVPAQIKIDLMRAVVIALVVWGIFAFQKWEPELLPAVLGVAGMAGQKFIDPFLKLAGKFGEWVSNILAGRPRE
jgi:hypothetical protein